MRISSHGTLGFYWGRVMLAKIWVLLRLGCTVSASYWAQELPKGLAFTTREVVRRFDGKGQEVVRETVTFAAKGDGSTAKHEKRVLLATSEVYEYVFVEDAVSHTSVVRFCFEVENDLARIVAETEGGSRRVRRCDGKSRNIVRIQSLPNKRIVG
jgi:hypothetical protein